MNWIDFENIVHRRDPTMLRGMCGQSEVNQRRSLVGKVLKRRHWVRTRRQVTCVLCLGELRD